MVVALGLALSACSGSAPAGATGSAQSAPTGTAPETTAATSALDFTAPTIDGGRFDASTLSGTAVVLWFWAPWCTICRAEAPGVAAAAAEYDGRVMFLGVPGRGAVGEMREFVADTGTGGLTHVVDADGALWQRFGVVAQPAFAFVDTDGTVATFGGSLDPESLRQAADDLLAG